MGEDSRGQVVEVSPMGLSIAQPPEDFAPSRWALDISNHLCPAPSATPGHEPLVPSMGILPVATLLRSAHLFQDTKLSMYSALLVREASPMDKEITDAMAICLKLLAMAILGRLTLTLGELLPGVPLDPEIAEIKFLVPYGQLSVGEGMRIGEQISKDEMQQRMESIRKQIVNSQAAEDLEAPLSIGFARTGNLGNNSCIVFVEAQNEQRAWLMSVQSKQHTGRLPSYDTCRAILRSMHADLKATHRLPELKGQWQTWHSEKPAPSKNPDTMPKGASSSQQQSQQWDSSDWQQRVIYAYVSDRLFSNAQDLVRQELLARGHPWMRRVTSCAMSSRLPGMAAKALCSGP